MDWIDTYTRVRNRTTALCSHLEKEDYIPQPVPFASPPKWHLAHSTWFFEEMILKKFDPSYEEYDPNFGFLFNSYYNFVGERTFRANRGNITRPGVEEVYAYRNYVDASICNLLLENSDPALLQLIELGLNHEQQHQELLVTDMKYMFGHNPIFPCYDIEMNWLADHNTESGWLKINEGLHTIGSDGTRFSFDNEHGQHTVFAHEFEISKALVTNGEYLEFIEAGGYEMFHIWLDEGWSWVQENTVQRPLYWHKIDGKWFYYTLAGLKEIDPKAILAHISYYEANAYAAWKGMRLPTEFEWEIAADLLDWGKRWEWTNSAYLPYPKFQIAEGAVGEYNGKFMINQMVLRGGSVATAQHHSRKTYRNFFHPHYQWQYSGIRLAK